MIKPFKGRKLDRKRKVAVYRNLRMSGQWGYGWSVVQDRKVIGHSPSLMLREAEFVVNESGRARAKRTKTRNVHAFVVGFVCETMTSTHPACVPVTYSPFGSQYFVAKGEEAPIFAAPYVTFSRHGCVAYYKTWITVS